MSSKRGQRDSADTLLISPCASGFKRAGCVPWRTIFGFVRPPRAGNGAAHDAPYILRVVVPLWSNPSQVGERQFHHQVLGADFRRNQRGSETTDEHRWTRTRRTMKPPMDADERRWVSLPVCFVLRDLRGSVVNSNEQSVSVCRLRPLRHHLWFRSPTSRRERCVAGRTLHLLLSRSGGDPQKGGALLKSSGTRPDSRFLDSPFSIGSFRQEIVNPRSGNVGQPTHRRLALSQAYAGAVFAHCF